MGRISVNMKIKCRRKRRMNYGYEFLRFFFSRKLLSKDFVLSTKQKIFRTKKKMEMHVVTTNQDNKKNGIALNFAKYKFTKKKIFSIFLFC